MALTPLWIAAASAGLIVLLVCALAIRAPQSDAVASAVRIGFFICAVVLFGSLTRAFFDGAASRGADADRRALELRATQLSAVALTPGSPLACLDGVGIGAVSAGCEKAVFATPTSVASASAYVAARFRLLSDMTAFAGRGGDGIDATMTPLRRALEADQFGVLAQVLQNREGCTAADCAALKLFHDASRVRANLKSHAFEHYVEQYREAWLKLPEPPLASVPESRPVGVIEPHSPGGHRAVVNIDFPTASSIPPISIMNPEPARTPMAPHETTGSANPGHRPAAPPGATAADPVWTPGR